MPECRTKIVGVINITPDSFADKNHCKNIDEVLLRVSSMLNSGVDVIDVGAESTRPGAVKISPQEEIRRLEEYLPEIYKLANAAEVFVSLDSRNHQTLKKYENHFDIINDVTGMEDPAIIDFQKSTAKETIFMRSCSIPVDKKKFISEGTDVFEYINGWLNNKIEYFVKTKIDLSKLIFDPGIGFGLGAKKDLELVKNPEKIELKGFRMLLGHSRKSFLKMFGEEEAIKRDPETHVISAYLIKKNIDFIRVHDVESTCRIKKLSKELI